MSKYFIKLIIKLIKLLEITLSIIFIILLGTLRINDFVLRKIHTIVVSFSFCHEMFSISLSLEAIFRFPSTLSFFFFFISTGF